MTDFVRHLLQVAERADECAIEVFTQNDRRQDGSCDDDIPDEVPRDVGKESHAGGQSMGKAEGAVQPETEDDDAAAKQQQAESGEFFYRGGDEAEGEKGGNGDFTDTDPPWQFRA